MPDQDIAYLSLSRLIDHYRARTLSPVEVAKNALEQIAAFNGPLNAFVSLSSERALEDARASEQRWVRGEPKGLLDGVPISVKDTLMVKGFPFRRGSCATSEEPVTESASWSIMRSIAARRSWASPLRPSLARARSPSVR